jgi:putative acetyltransferase
MKRLDDIGVRPAVDADGAGVAALIARVFAEYEGCRFDPAEFPELVHPATHYAAKGGAIWVAARGEEIVGSLAVFRNGAPGAFEIGKVYVDAILRGAGLAARLLDMGLARARQDGAREIVLFSDTRFTRGHAFYEKHGFRRLPGVRIIHDISKTLEFGYRRALEQTA